MKETINTKHGIVIISEENEYLYPNLKKETQVTYQPASGYYIATSFLKEGELPDGKKHGPTVIAKDIDDAIEQAESALDWLQNAQVEHDKTGMAYVAINDGARMILTSPEWMKGSQIVTVRDADGELDPHVTLDPGANLTVCLRSAYVGWQNRRTITKNKQ